MDEMARKIDAHDAADWFINKIDRRMGELITLDVVHRLVFFAQAWYLANTGLPMFDDEFEAWGTGPVIPTLYRRFENLAAASIPDIENSRPIKGRKLEMLECIQRDYGCYMPFKLEELAREPGGPWHEARAGLGPLAPSNRVIPKATMRDFYRGQLKNAA